eukprot:g18701.t1
MSGSASRWPACCRGTVALAKLCDFLDGKKDKVAECYNVTGFVHSFFTEFNQESISRQCPVARNVDTGTVPTEWAAARDLDSLLHAYNECIYNELLPPIDPRELGPEYVQFMKFKRYIETEKGWVPFRTELTLCSSKYLVAGSCDILFIDVKTNRIYICGWKRSKQIRLQGWDNRVGWGPCHSMPDCNYSHYCLQLNTYRELAELQLKKQVGGMYLLIFHPNQDNFRFLEVPDLGKVTRQCLGMRRVNLVKLCVQHIMDSGPNDSGNILDWCLMLDYLRKDDKFSIWFSMRQVRSSDTMRHTWEILYQTFYCDCAKVIMYEEKLDGLVFESLFGVGHYDPFLKHKNKKPVTVTIDTTASRTAIDDVRNEPDGSSLFF